MAIYSAENSENQKESLATPIPFSELSLPSDLAEQAFPSISSFFHNLQFVDSARRVMTNCQIVIMNAAFDIPE
jgi:hypothetical protein